MATDTPENQSNGVDAQASAQSGAPVATSKYSSLSESMSSTMGGFKSGLKSFISQSVVGETTKVSSQQAAGLTNQIQVVRADLSKSIQMVQANQLLNRTDLLAATNTLKEFQEQQLAEKKQEENETRLQIAKERREQKESLLEGFKRSLLNTGQAIGSTFNNLTNLSLLDRLKKFLGLMAAGIAITNWDLIWGGLQALADNWQRIGMRLTAAVLRPVGRFFAGILDFAGRIFKWGFEVLNGFRRVVSKAFEFVGSLGKRLFDTLARFVSRILNLGKEAFNGVRPKTDTDGDKGVRPATDGDAPGNKGGAPGGDPSIKRPKGNWLSRNFSLDNILKNGKNITKGLASGVYQGANFLTGGTLESAREAISKKFKQASKLLTPITSAFDKVKSALKTLVTKKDPSDLIKVLKGFGKTVKNVMKSSGKQLDNILGGAAGAISGVGRMFGDASAQKMLRSLGREARIGFPIDLLLNRYMGDQPWDEAFMRAIGSTVGSWAVPSPLGGMIGGEAGDYMMARFMNYPTRGNLVSGLYDWVMSLNNGDEASATTTDAGGMTIPADVQPMNKISPSRTPPLVTKPSVKESPGALTGDVTPKSQSSSSSVGAHTESAAYDYQITGSNTTGSLSPNNILRNPRMDRGTSTNKSGVTNNVNVSTMSLPAQSIDAGGNTVNVGGGGQQSAEPINPLPSLASKNGMSDIYEMSAASIFGISLPA